MKALPVVLILALLAACSAPAPTPDAPATEAAIAARIFATLTAAAPPPAMPEPITPTLNPTPVPPQTAATLSHTPSPPPTVTPSPLPSPPPTLTDTPAPAATTERAAAVVTGQSLNVRAGPGTVHPVIGVLRQGEAVQVTGRDATGAWLEIRLADGTAGWVGRSLVRTNPQADAIAVAVSIPTAPAPAATRAAPPASGRQDLEVAYLNLHYECQRTEWQDLVRVWGYRSFQADLYIKNNSSGPVQPPWSPARWIITDGANERVSELIWEWGHVQTGLYDQPSIAPGQSAGWTFMAFPIERDEWVKAVEFEWQGQRYRTEFDLGPYGNAHNYLDCGDYPATTGPRTPVPVDTPVGPGDPGSSLTPVR